MTKDAPECLIPTGSGSFLYPEIIGKPSARLHSEQGMIAIQGETKDGVDLYIPVDLSAVSLLADALVDPLLWPDTLPGPDEARAMELAGSGPFALPLITSVQPPAFQRGRTILTPCFAAGANNSVRGVLRIAASLVKELVPLLRTVHDAQNGVESQEFAQMVPFSLKKQ
jgi:hypothetical protein